MKNGNQNISCEFFADIVAYLYNETGDTERRKFEAHLAGCGACTDEFAAISNARYSIYEWRKEEFAHLSTPEIIIPYADSKPAVKREGIFSTLAKLVTGRIWNPYVPAFAGLLACAGLVLAIFMFSGSGNSPTVAKNESVPTAVPNSKPSDLPAKVEEPEVAKTGDKISEPDSALLKKTGPESSLNSSATRTVKIVARRNDTMPNRIARQTSGTGQRNGLDKPKTPVLSKYDEYDDKSLRLSDLFDDGGSL